ncbi:MAG: presenilin family intramembrane aspartyl protease [Nanoarchaeota archaeon]
MKHNVKVTAILIIMFLVTQFIGLAVIYAYMPHVKQIEINGTLQNVTTNPIPYGMEPAKDIDKDTSLVSLLIAFVIAILFVFLLTKLKAALFMKLWFFVVVVLVLGISFNAPLQYLLPSTFISSIIALIIAIPLAIFKVFKQNMIVHNLTELFIYPGISVVFIPLLNVWSIILLLVIISVYDIWAVWHSGLMQKMAKFQIQEMKVFAGFFLPYLNKKQKAMVQEAKLSKTKSKSLKNKEMKVSVAILGGGDVVFPIITAGVIFYTLGFIPALIVSLCATIALLGLFTLAKKGKFYPAMPFITAGLFVGIALAYLVKYLI